MIFKSIIGATCTCLAVVSFNANAAVANTLNGIDYEWLDFSVTIGLSRDQVEAQIATAAPGDALYGYQYASRALTEDLLLSYTTWDGLSGWHSNPVAIAGMDEFIKDFGTTNIVNFVLTTITTVEGDDITYNYRRNASFLYGSSGECFIGLPCWGFQSVLSLKDVNDTAVSQDATLGWDSTDPNTHYFTSTSTPNLYIASLLVREAIVPIPPAAWLFGSGLIGLVGLARRKAHV